MTREMELLEKTLAEHKPYAMIIADGTGTYPKGDSELFHLVVQEFSYDETSENYAPSKRFEGMIKTSEEEKKKIEFDKLGINQREYESKAESKSAFANDFLTFVMEELEMNDTTFIGNGIKDYCMNFLEKTNSCAEPFKDENKDILPFAELMREYLSEHGVDGRTDIRLHRFLGKEGNPDKTANGKIALYSEMINRHCEEKHLLEEKTKTPVQQENVQKESVPSAFHQSEEKADDFDDIFEETYEQPIAPKPAPAVPAVPPQRQHSVTEMPEGMQRYFNEQEKAVHEAWVRKGKKNYEEQGISGKTEILRKIGKLDTEAVLDETSDCDLHRLQRIMKGEYECNEVQNEGFTIFQVGTTGIGTMGKDDATGFPMQISLQSFKIDKNDDGEISFRPVRRLSMQIPADEGALRQAIEKADKGGFDTFAHGKIDRAEYLELCRKGTSDRDKMFYTVAEAINRLQKIFDECPTETYPLISAGRARGHNENSFSQEALKYIFSHSMTDAVSVDFSQATKEYAFAVETMEQYDKKNVMIPEGKTPKNFSMDSIAQVQGKTVAGSKEKCIFMAEMVKALSKQLQEIEREKNAERVVFPEEKKPKKQETAGVPVQNRYDEDSFIPRNENIDEQDMPNFINMPETFQPQQNTEVVKPKQEIQNVERDELSAAMSELDSTISNYQNAPPQVKQFVSAAPPQQESEPMIPESLVKGIVGETVKEATKQVMQTFAPLIQTVQQMSADMKLNLQYQALLAKGQKTQIEQQAMANEHNQQGIQEIHKNVEHTGKVIEQQNLVLETIVDFAEANLETQKSLGHITKSAEQTAVKAAEIGADTEKLKVDVNHNTDAIQKLGETVEKHEQDIRSTRADISKIRENVANIKIGVSQAKSGMSQTLSVFKDFVGEFEKTVNEQNQRIDNIADNVSNIADYVLDRDEHHREMDDLQAG